MAIKLKRVYQEPENDDGSRILVERLWPRGVSKARADLTEWLKDIAPSTELRKWYGHDVSKWHEFQKRYEEELKAKVDLIAELARKAKKEKITFLYAARYEEHNSAVVLKNFLEKYRKNRLSKAHRA